MDQITITLNGEPADVPARCDIHGLLAHLDIGEAAVAVAINAEVVPRDRWTSTLTAADEVEIVRVTAGG